MEFKGGAFLKVEVTGDGILKMKDAVRDVASPKMKSAYRMAINEVGRRAKGRVVKAVAKQMGTTGKAIAKRGGIRTSPATNESLSYSIHAAGGYLKLKDFGAIQRKSGVSASPWGKRRIFEGTFIVESLGGHVFKRDRLGGKVIMTKGRYEGQKRHRIEALFGPAVPKEIVRDKSKLTFENFANIELPKRVEHQIKRLTHGTVS